MSAIFRLKHEATTSRSRATAGAIRGRSARARRFRLQAEVIAGIAACLCGWAFPVFAQQPPRESRIEVAVGVGLLGGASVSDTNADLRGGSQSNPTYRLFASEARLARAPAIEARVAWRFAPRFAVEAHGMRAGQDLRVSVSADAEGAPPITVAERIDRYIVDAGLIVLLDELRVAGLVPFAVAGAGYLRQLHEGAALVEQGHVYHAGAGVKRSVMSRTERFLDGIGLRADARVYVFGDGLTPDDSPRPYLSVTGSVVLAF
jgi:hypothetical protein